MTKKKAILYFLLLIAGFFVGYFLKPATKAAIPNVTESLSNPLIFLVSVDTPKGTVYLYLSQDSIYFSPIVTPYRQIIPTINKEKYPKLFKQGISNSSALYAEYYKESRDGETYIKIANIQPDHGGHDDVYAILADPFTGIVKENKLIDEISGRAIF